MIFRTILINKNTQLYSRFQDFFISYKTKQMVQRKIFLHTITYRFCALAKLISVIQDSRFKVLFRVDIQYNTSSSELFKST